VIQFFTLTPGWAHSLDGLGNQSADLGVSPGVSVNVAQPAVPRELANVHRRRGILVPAGMLVACSSRPPATGRRRVSTGGQRDVHSRSLTRVILSFLATYAVNPPVAPPFGRGSGWNPADYESPNDGTATTTGVLTPAAANSIRAVPKCRRRLV